MWDTIPLPTNKLFFLTVLSRSHAEVHLSNLYMISFKFTKKLYNLTTHQTILAGMVAALFSWINTAFDKV